MYKQKSKYIVHVLQQVPDEHGKLRPPTRAQSAQWAAEAFEEIPRRTIVRSFVACRVTRPEDYEAAERSAFGLDSLVHGSVARALADVVDDDDELKAQLEAASDADDDE